MKLEHIDLLIHLFWHDPYVTAACIVLGWVVAIGAMLIIVVPFCHLYRRVTGRRIEDDLFEWERRWLVK